MVYRYSWIVGLVALGFSFTQLNNLLRPTSEGVPWQFVVLAAGVLGIIITWAGLTYRMPGWSVILLNGAALVISVTRVSAPNTSRFLLPTGATYTELDSQLNLAMDIIRSGVEPVIPLVGIVIVIMAVFWVAGVILAWGLLRNHPYVALVPPLVLTMQFATMNRGPSSFFEIFLFVVLVAVTILAIATDERTQTIGRMAPRGAWPASRGGPPASSVGVLGVTIVAALVSVQLFQGIAPPDGWFDWRRERGLGTGYLGSVSYNPFVSIQQSLVSGSQAPVFQARLTGDVPADQVYFQFVTMDTYNGGQFFASDTPIETLEEFPYERSDAAFAGPTEQITAEIVIDRLRQEWLPSTYAVTSVAAEERLRRDLRIRPDDASVVFPGGLTFQGMRYQVTASLPQPDLSVLATDVDGELSVAFEYAASSDNPNPIDAALLPTPSAVEVRSEPPDVERYLLLPEDEASRMDEIAALARERTANLTTDFERAIALEDWFHTPATFAYKLLQEDEVGHGATDLAAWLLDEGSPNHHQGYCENFATAMAVMARTLDIPSRVVLGFTPGQPNPDDPDWVVVRDANAHAWVELWMPAQGWVRFDPTPRFLRDTPQTFEIAANELGFDITEHLAVPAPDTFDFTVDNLPPQLGEFLDDEFLANPGVPGSTPDTGFRLPSWLSTIGLWIVIALLVVGGLPSLKWWQRRRRIARLRDGDITAAWEDIVARLDDLGETIDATATPHEVAESIDPAMRPLATVYGRAIYGPEGSVNDAHIATATRALEDTTMRLATRYSQARRTMAWYRMRSLLPDRLRRRRARK
jgi:transglutaminase-like putative cysteine protease